MSRNHIDNAPDDPRDDYLPVAALRHSSFNHDHVHEQWGPSEGEHWPVAMPPPTAPHFDGGSSQLSASSNPKEVPAKSPMSKRWKVACACLVPIVICAVAISVALTFSGRRTASNASTSQSAATATPQSRPTRTPPQPTSAPLSQSVSTLDAIHERGFLRCGVTDQLGFSAPSNGTRVGFEVDLCRAVGATIFGDDSKLELVVVSYSERFIKLGSGKIDVIAAGATYTMQRDVFEPSTKAGFTFSTPYIYGGLGFAGQPQFVECAEARKIAGSCTGLKICALDGTTHVGILKGLFPSISGIVLAPTTQDLYRNFADDICNVLAGEQFDVPEVLVRQAGYTGNFTVGLNQFSKEPLALVTRDDDVKWSVFVDWVVLALLTAEDRQVTQSVASAISENPTSLVDASQVMFIHAIAAVGNYAEIYERHLEPFVPRAGLNLLNNGSSPLIYSFPLGNTSVIGPEPTSGDTLEAIVERGFLRCGIAVNDFFAVYNYTSDRWTGLNSDFCRAVTAAIFGAVDGYVVFVAVDAAERFQKLQGGDIDLLSRQTSATYERATMEPTTKQGFSFSRPVFYTGVQFGGIPVYLQCAERFDVTSGDCTDLKICVQNGTTTIDRVRQLFPERYINAQSTEQLVAECLANGKGNVIAGDGFDTANTTIRQHYSGPYKEGAKLFSRESLTLVTRQNDTQWTSFINSIVTATFYAEEQGISQSNYALMPVVNLFGPTYASMFKNLIRAVGSYGDIYERSAGSRYPRTVLNKLNTAPFGPEQYPLPGLQL